MEQTSYKRNRKTKAFWNVFMVFSVICIVMTMFGFQYYKKLNETIYEESKGYLQEVTRRIGSNVDRIFNDNFGILNTMVACLENMENPTNEKIQKNLRKQFPAWDYEGLMLIDSQGKTVDLNGKEVFLTLEDSVRENLLAGTNAMSTTQMIDNKEYIIFFVPFTNFSADGTDFVALAGSYAPESFHEVLSMKSFNDKSYSHIISKNGSIVIRSSSEVASNIGYNIFASIQNAKFNKGETIEKFQKDISVGNTGQVGVIIEEEHMYMIYVPIQTADLCILTFVPVQVVNEKSDLLLTSTMVIGGCIALIFAGLAAVITFTFNSHRRKLEEIAYVDSITGGNTIQRFYQLAGQCLENQNRSYAMIYTNIVKFKVLNEQFGRQNCDTMLRSFYECVDHNLLNYECVGRLGGDNFCILMEYIDEESIIKRLEELYHIAQGHVQSGTMPWSFPVTEIGIYVIENSDMAFSRMIDRAKLVNKEAARNIENKLYYSFYEDSLSLQMMREKQLEDRMVDALKTKEFQVFLQPKYHLPEEKIGGAEALVRWKSNAEGMIFPDEFIPLFEKNGFIVQLDLFVYEEVCSTLRAWIDQGLEPVKISVNCSRLHFRDPNFLQPYIQLAEKYDLDKRLIEIEVTESMVLENSDRLIQIIENIQEAGFECSMDDFGSGYSSLNLIQTIPVNTLKIDKIFFCGSLSDMGRTKAVVKSIISMASELKMITVAEGVEHREQVEMLKTVGCDYVQGYVFSKPLPIPQFEELAFGRLSKE